MAQFLAAQKRLGKLPLRDLAQDVSPVAIELRHHVGSYLEQHVDPDDSRFHLLEKAGAEKGQRSERISSSRRIVSTAFTARSSWQSRGSLPQE